MWVSTTPAPALPDRHREAALSCLLWAGIILGFFTLSSRQEYYHLPALPALALLVGGLLAAADAKLSLRIDAAKQALRGSLYFLVPLGTLLFLVCGYFALTSPTPHPGVTLNDALSRNPADYDLSLGHIFDLTGQAMGFFRGPLLAVALCMFTLGPIAYLVRRRNTFAANLLVAAAMAGVLLATHEGLVRFYPILGSKPLAEAIDAQSTPATSSSSTANSPPAPPCSSTPPRAPPPSTSSTATATAPGSEASIPTPPTSSSTTPNWTASGPAPTASSSSPTTPTAAPPTSPPSPPSTPSPPPEARPSSRTSE